MTEVAQFNAMIADPDRLKLIGSQIVKRAIIATLETKLDLVPSNTAGVRSVREGDVVPADLRSKVPLGAGAIATKNWSDAGWTDIGIWERATWDKQGTGLTIQDIRSLPINERDALLGNLTDVERTTLTELGFL